MGRSDWYRLDNVGKFYAAQAGHWGQTVFRLSAVLQEKVRPDLLQNALDKTVKRYPGFNVSLRSGFFWHYLEPSGEMPLVRKETLPICFGVHRGPRSVLFRVSYYEHRINFEVSHIISDGRGSLRFFKDLLRFYLGDYLDIPAPVDALEDTATERSEDSFRRYYERDEATSTSLVRAYRMSGLRNATEPVFMEYHLPAHELVAWAKRWNISVTSLIIASVIISIRDTMPTNKRNRPIRMDVPVDLRDMYGSSTMRNFFGLAYVSYTPGPIDESFEAIALNVQEQVVQSCSADAIKGRMNRMISFERNPFLRAAPIFLKDAALEGISRLSALDVTTTVSSLGVISLDPALDSHVLSMSLLTATTGLNFTICTFRDDLCIGISTRLVRLDALRNLCRIFSDAGIHGRIDCNLDAKDVERRRREGRWVKTENQRTGAANKRVKTNSRQAVVDDQIIKGESHA